MYKENVPSKLLLPEITVGAKSNLSMAKSRSRTQAIQGSALAVGDANRKWSNVHDKTKSKGRDDWEAAMLKTTLPSVQNMSGDGVHDYRRSLIERFRFESLHPKAKLVPDASKRNNSMLDGPETANVVPDEAMLRHASSGTVGTSSGSSFACAFEGDLPHVPTCIVPISRDRQVLLKIGNSFLRVGNGSLPMVSKYKPPLYPNINLNEDERLTDLKGCKTEKDVDTFDFPDFTFYVDETATVMESWYRNTRDFFNIRIGVRRDKTFDKEYLAVRWTGANRRHLQYQSSQSGAWWQLLCVGDNRYVCESVTSPGSCLTKNQFGLTLTETLTRQQRTSLTHGKWPSNATLTIHPLPTFAVWKPGAVVA